jgi:hypothetical protein
MIIMTAFKSAFDRIKADDALRKKTEEYLRKRIAGNTLRRTHLFFGRIVPVTCAIILICGISIGAYKCFNTPTSYLSLDINPSVELGVNAFGKVVSALSYNNDGTAILAGQKVIHLGVKDAVNTLVKSAAQKGFISNDGSTVIALTSETDNASTAAKLEKEAELGAKTAVKSAGNSAVIHKENVALETRNEAKKLGITPGKLNLIQKIQALDPSVTVDHYKNAKITEILKKLNELKRAQKSRCAETHASNGLSGDKNGSSVSH